MSGECGSCGFRARAFESGVFECEISGARLEYPGSGHNELASVEKTSYWFSHRKDVITAAVRRYPWRGPLLDVGGGNGFQARALSAEREGVVLVEPGTAGCRNAVDSGFAPVVHATLESMCLRDGSVGGVALFDVLEHLASRKALLSEVRRILRPEGRIYVTVPSLRWLWSSEDVRAEHKLRYSPSGLREELTAQGYEIEFMTYFFMPLVPAIFLLRTLPTIFGCRGADRTTEREHGSEGILGRALRAALIAEAVWISGGHTLPLGSSLLCVARKR
jgi:SAM-dependent methyltransferase